MGGGKYLRLTHLHKKNIVNIYWGADANMGARTALHRTLLKIMIITISIIISSILSIIDSIIISTTNSKGLKQMLLTFLQG